MEETLKILLANPSHSNDISKILALAFEEFKNKYTTKAYEATVIPDWKVEQRINEGFTWLALMESRPVGTVSGYISNRIFYIQGMAVLPEERAKKIGYYLLKEIEQFAMENNCTELLLSTTPYLTNAISLYEKYGFVIINEPPYDLYQTPLFNMRKILSQ